MIVRRLQRGYPPSATNIRWCLAIGAHGVLMGDAFIEHGLLPSVQVIRFGMRSRSGRARGGVGAAADQERPLGGMRAGYVRADLDEPCALAYGWPTSRDQRSLSAGMMFVFPSHS